MVTAYCLSYGNWTVIPHQWDECFGELASLGYDAIALSYSESDEVYCQRTFELQIRTAHKHGLKVFAIPSRLGARFAGAPMMYCRFLAEHPEYTIPGYPHLGCLESEPFVDFVRNFVRKMAGKFELDGVIWDEPGEADVVSTHPDTLKFFNREQTTEEAQDRFLWFLDTLMKDVDEIRPGSIQTIFNQKCNPEYFCYKSARLPLLDYYGYDGTLSDQSFFHEPKFHNKYQIFEIMPRMRRELNGKSFCLLENILLPNTALPEFEENLERFLSTENIDQLCLYYYGHNNEDPEKAQQITNRLLTKYISRFK